MKWMVIFIIFIFSINSLFAEYVNTNGLNVRSEPSSEAQILGQLRFSERIEVIETSGGWSKIHYNNQEGWVSSQFLSVNEPVKTTNKTVVQSVGDFLKKTLLAVLAFLVLLYRPLHNVAIQLGFVGGWATFAAIVAEFIIICVILSILHKIFLQFTLYRCPSCGKIAALKYAGRSEVVGSWTSSEKRTAEIRGRNGNVIGTRDEYVPVTKEEIKSLYCCKYCGKYTNIYRTHTK